MCTSNNMVLHNQLFILLYARCGYKMYISGSMLLQISEQAGVASSLYLQLHCEVRRA